MNDAVKPDANRVSGEGQPAASPPSLSLPKGGGAIRGMGEKFAANPVTGSGSVSVPIVTSPGRSGFGPQLSLSYDSGAGNGPFGVGWSLSLPSITRKTDKGLPRYFDAEESDVFILSGAEDLVPLLVKNGNTWVRESLPFRNVNGVDYRVQRYRPRIEGLFARVERWTSQADSKDTFWRSISKDNITTWYGKTESSRVADPGDATHIFSWLICESYDDKGNVIEYHYKTENSDDVDAAQANERNRTPDTRKANQYLKHIRFGNHAPYFPKLIETAPWPTLPPDDKWYFEVVFDYGEHDVDAPTPNGEVATWTTRNDPFSYYRAGFEVRTYRLCQRVLMFHHFPDEPDVGADCLVRSTDFAYSYEEDPTNARNRIYSLLLSVTQSGYKRNSTGGYLKKSLPSVDFSYTEATIQEETREVDPVSIENLPIGLDGPAYQWTDLHGEGLSGILSEQAEGWFYKRNLSPINLKTGNGGVPYAEPKFAPLELIATKPNLALAGGQAQFMDLAGDGKPDLVVLDGPMPGLYEHDSDESWGCFRPFTARLNRDTRDPNLKFVDLDGDGHADVLISEDDAFVWHTSLAEEGFGPARRLHQPLDEEKGPRLVFADGTQSIYLADFSGDGLTDLARIRSGEICYWPNLGYGSFGPKVTMDNAPWFDSSDAFDQKRIRLADIDGSGTTDIIYLHRDGARLYFNQSGNSWSAPRSLNVFPRVDNLVAITPVDLLGNGTACLVWSSPLPGDTRQHMRYVDLMGGKKPHLLVKIVNNLGEETVLSYAPSTKFYLQDKQDGRPWVTKLPFPVHCVERVETLDLISQNRFVTRYAYHHGYFDGEEREFRGFGMVEQWDTSELASLKESGMLPDTANIDESSYVPPTYTKTWFHTGAWIEEARISRHFEEEYYREGDQSEDVSGLTDEQLEAMLLPDTELPTTLKMQDSSSIPWELTAEEIQEASRALRGSVLRREIYGLDGTDDEDRPYTAGEQNYTIELLQPRGGQRHAVFFAHPRESIDFHYERKLIEVAGGKLADPRVTHAMTLEADGYGNVLKSVAIGYGRRQDLSPLEGDDKKKQEQLLITYTEKEVTNPVDETDDYRTPLPTQARTYELLKTVPNSNLPGITNLFRFDEMLAEAALAADGNHDLPYQDIAASGATANHPYRRQIEHVRTFYRKNDLTGPSALGEVESLALPFETYKLAFTDQLAKQIFITGNTNLNAPDEAALADMLSMEGRYVHSTGDANWWIPSGRVLYSRDPASAVTELTEAKAHFFLPRRFEDAFSNPARVDYDPYELLLAGTEDALQNKVTATNNYRVLQLSEMIDPNGNHTEVAFDALGMVVGTAIKGKVPAGASESGDSLDNFTDDLAEADIAIFFDDPTGKASDYLGSATTRIIYDLGRFSTTQKTNPDNPEKWEAVFAATIAREKHVNDPPPDGKWKYQVSFSYSDGFGREIQKKIQAEPGPVPQRDGNGKIVVDADGQPVMTADDFNPRWVGSGWTIFNNKGKPVRQFEPFFSGTHKLDADVRVGVSSILFYDPLERLVATLHPNHTYEKVVVDPWQQTVWDVNDTVLVADAKTDPDVGDFFKRLPDADYLPSWHTQRLGGALGTPEQQAAQKAAAHANTPAVSHFDSLDRTFLTVADNGTDEHGNPQKYNTRIELDIEGNRRSITDALERVVLHYDYDMLSNRTHQQSMDAGERWTLNDVIGKPIRTWDSRGFMRRMTLDELRRPIGLFVTEAGTERLLEQTVYGESQGSANNLRTRIYQAKDSAGIVTNVAYDFKGNLLRSGRQLLAGDKYKATVDWNESQTLDETFDRSSRFDALSRMIQQIAPHNDKPGTKVNIIQPTYNEANLLEALDAWLEQGTEPIDLLDPLTASFRPVTNVDYNAKGQRTVIEYSNGARTDYDYDPETFRLINLRTDRNVPLGTQNPGKLQNLSYAYDPVGNITHIRDDGQKTVIWDGAQVEPVALYTYDALYRLIKAEGREHAGQNANLPLDHTDFIPIVAPDPNDPQVMRNYTEEYTYDPAGNIREMGHHAKNNNWVRVYGYETDPTLPANLNNPDKLKSNRLVKTTPPGRTEGSATDYTDDPHGNMTKMPHLFVMEWDVKDQLHATQQQVVNDGPGEKTYYVYNAAGQRVRKVTETMLGQVKEERIYLGALEIYRKHTGTNAGLERETLLIMDDKQCIAMVESRNNVDDGSPAQLMRFQFANHLGSASLELDDQAQIISYEEYTAYGTTSYQAGRSQTETPKRYRYTGKERDEESGLYYYGVRFYSSWLGRWTSCDPAGMVDGLNLYSSTKNNPVVYADSVGKDSSHILIQGIDWTAGGKIDKKEAAYYGRIIPVILEQASAKGIRFQQAVFMIAQAKSEQGGGFTDPAEVGNRLFNMQMPQAQFEKLRSRAGGKVLDRGPYPTAEPGVSVKQLPSDEHVPVIKDGKPVVIDGKPKLEIKTKWSPFFQYETLERSVTHYLDRLATKYSEMLGKLINETSTMSDFAGAVKSVKYGTHVDYVPDLIDNYREVLKYLTTIMRYEIQQNEKTLKEAGEECSVHVEKLRTQIMTLKTDVAALETALNTLPPPRKKEQKKP